MFAITALSVFVLPENVLDVSAACADFVKFMSSFSKHRRNRQDQPAYAACGILRRGIVDRPCGIFRDKPDIHTDKFVLYEKREPRGVKTHPLCFFGIFIGYLRVTLPPILP